MTCIIGWIEGNKVWIGGDSAGVGGLKIRTRADEKVFKNGEMLFGYTSSFRLGQLLRYSLEIPEQSKKKDDYEYMCTDFIDAVSEMLKKKNYAEISDNKMKIGFFLVGYKGNLYEIESDLQVAKPTLNYEAVGCGADIAMGALHSLNSFKMKPKERITKALQAAAEFSTGVRSPFIIKEL